MPFDTETIQGGRVRMTLASTPRWDEGLEVVVSSAVCVPMRPDVSPSQARRNRELGTTLESDGSGEPVVGRVVDGFGTVSAWSNGAIDVFPDEISEATG
jgi:hypothetical protein